MIVLTPPSQKNSSVTQTIHDISLEYLKPKSPQEFFSSPEESPFKFYVVSNRELRERAYKLAYQTYLDKGFIKANKNKWFINESDASPSTFTILAEDADGQDAGTMSISFEEDGDLPCEEIFSKEVRELRSKNKRLAEGIRICISDKHRHSKGLVIKMINILYTYTYRVRKYSDFLIEVNPNHTFFYEKLMGFEACGQTKKCNRVSGAPAVFMVLCLRGAQEKLSTARLDQSKKRNVYHSFFNQKSEDRLITYLKSHWGPMPAEDYKYFGVYPQSKFDASVSL